MNAPVTYDPTYLSTQVADWLFDKLWSEAPWERREFAPRREYWTNIFGQSYTYGRGAGERTYLSQPEHIGVTMASAMLHLRLGFVYEGCFLNGYDDGSDALGWHADDDPFIDHAKPIAVISLGGERDIQFKSKEPGSHPETQLLKHGSLLLMHAGMQDTHYHRIPKTDKLVPARISLTFRSLIKKAAQ